MFEKIYKKSLFSHICSYPYLKFEDIYKFLYQAVCGNVHLLRYKENFIESLYKEVQVISQDLNLNQVDFESKDKFNTKYKDNAKYKDKAKYKYKDKTKYKDEVKDKYKNKDKYNDKTKTEIELNNEPLIEYLRSDKKYIRLNLRPYLKSGYEIDLLKKACILSAEKNKENEEKDKEDFIKLWSEFSKKVFEQSFYEECEKYCKNIFSFSPILKDKTKEFFKISLSCENLEKFNLFIVSKNYPVIHHSQEYLYLYKPSYRVLELKDLLSKLKLNS